MESAEEQAATPAADEPAAATESTQFEHESPPNTGIAALKDHIAENKANFAMFLLRMVVVVASLAYLVPIKLPARAAYVTALLATLVTSALRLRQRLPTPQLSREFAATLMLEDAAHYVLFALVFVYPPPLTLVVVPITLFAVLHSASYLLRMLDVVGPASAPPLRYLISVVEVQSVTMLRTVAIVEILLLPYCIIALIVGRGNFLLPFIYYRFLTLRYSSRRNPYSRAIFGEMRHLLDTQAASPRCPAPLGNAIRKATSLVARLSPPMAPPSQ